MSKARLKNGAALPASAVRVSARGEVDLGFRKLKIKITLGAMADAEDEFGCDFSAIEEHLGSTRNLAKFIAILARAAGEEVSETDVEAIRRCDLEVSELMARISAATGASAQGNAQGNALRA